MELELILTKESQNRLSDESIKTQLKQISEAANGRTNCGGIIGKVKDIEPCKENEDKYQYQAKIVLIKKKVRSEDVAERQLEVARKYIEKSAGYRNWSLKGSQRDIEEAAALLANKEPLVIPDELTDDDIAREFPNLYERNPHLKIIHSVIKTAINSGFKERNNVLLFGNPGTAKTSVFAELKKYLEKDKECSYVSIIDSTTMSKAGIERWLIEQSKMGALTEILVFEELEKLASSNPDSISSFLSLLDGRGEVGRLNARQGKIKEKVECLVFATSNSPTALQKVFDGALWSRFAFRLPCVRPSREIARSILIDKIQARKSRGQEGEIEWADKIIEYYFDKKGINDVRTCIGALAGGNRIITGEFFKDLEEIEQAYEKEKKDMEFI